MSVAHMLKPAKIIDPDAVHLLPEAKRVRLLAILNHTGFEDCTFFREQFSFVLMALEDYPPKLVTDHDLVRICQCKVESIEWQVFMPYFSAVLMRIGYNGPAIVILDGCTCHAIGRIQVGLRAKRRCLTPLPPHPSDQTQPLDLGVLATVRRFCLSPITGAYSPQSFQAMHIFDAWQRTTVPRVIVAAFRVVEFVPVECDGEIYLEVDLPQAHRIGHWTEAPHIEDVVSAAGLKRLRLDAETRE
jgi:hypothetical protein